MQALPRSSQAQRMARLEDLSQRVQSFLGTYSPGSRLTDQVCELGEGSPTVAVRVGMGLSSPRRLQCDTFSSYSTVVDFEH